MMVGAVERCQCRTVEAEKCRLAQPLTKIMAAMAVTEIIVMRTPIACTTRLGARSSLHSVHGPDDPGRGVSSDRHPVQPDDAQERVLVPDPIVENLLLNNWMPYDEVVAVPPITW